jgi:hypothetical protein
MRKPVSTTQPLHDAVAQIEVMALIPTHIPLRRRRYTESYTHANCCICRAHYAKNRYLSRTD